jgi:hypothetical protein
MQETAASLGPRFEQAMASLKQAGARPETDMRQDCSSNCGACMASKAYADVEDEVSWSLDYWVSAKPRSGELDFYIGSDEDLVFILLSLCQCTGLWRDSRGRTIQGM